MKETDELLNIKDCIEFCEKICLTHKYSLSSPEFAEEQEIEIKKSDKGFGFEIHQNEWIIHQNEWKFKDLNLRSDFLNAEVPYLFFTQKIIGKGFLPIIQSNFFNKDIACYYRLVIPTNSKVNIHYSVENVIVNYLAEKKINTSEATEISLFNVNYLLYYASGNYLKSNQSYLIIEADTELPFEEFSESCYAILIAFGYVSGDFVQNDGYYFQYSQQEKTSHSGFYYSSLRKSIKCQYVPIYSNPHGYIHNHDTADKYMDKVRTLSLSEFSKLCQLTRDSDDFKSILLLIIESNTQSLVSSPGILSIALETLAKIIYSENEQTLSPVKAKATFRKLRDSLLLALDSYKGVVEDSGIIILKAKIEQLNQRTNRDKLLVPFEILNIPITDMDKDSIEQRNAFLHGKNPMLKNVAPGSIDEADKTRYYLYLRLYTLISAIVMKYIGFDSLIVNYPKIYEGNTGVKLEAEHHYRQI